MNFHLKPKNAAPIPVGYTKRFKHYLPIFEGEEAHVEKDTLALAKAQKYERKMREKFVVAFTAGKQVKKAARHYLRSKRCLQANMVAANAKRPLNDRLSLHQIIEQSMKYDVLKNLNEPATIFPVPKPDGGFRQICNFGPVARGAQRMVLKLLRATYKPAPFQFTHKSVKVAIQTALKAISEEGLNHVAEIDIKGHFPSFTAGELIKALPLPKAAVEQIIMAENATWTGPFVPTGLLSVFPQTPTGMPQGSAASNEVAIWSVSHLKMPITVNGSVIVNYADNFFVFANTKFALDATCNLLRSAIARLSGGDFLGVPKLTGTVETGFQMLGCDISLVQGQLSIEPTQKSQDRLYNKMDALFYSAATFLEAAFKDKCPKQRFQGLQDILRLQAYGHGWLASYGFVDLDGWFEDDLNYYLSELKAIYAISDDELNDAKDASTRKKPDQYGYLEC